MVDFVTPKGLQAVAPIICPQYAGDGCCSWQQNYALYQNLGTLVDRYRIIKHRWEVGGGSGIEEEIIDTVPCSIHTGMENAGIDRKRVTLGNCFGNGDLGVTDFCWYTPVSLRKVEVTSALGVKYLPFSCGRNKILS